MARESPPPPPPIVVARDPPPVLGVCCCCITCSCDPVTSCVRLGAAWLHVARVSRPRNAEDSSTGEVARVARERSSSCSLFCGDAQKPTPRFFDTVFLTGIGHNGSLASRCSSHDASCSCAMSFATHHPASLHFCAAGDSPARGVLSCFSSTLGLVLIPVPRGDADFFTTATC